MIINIFFNLFVYSKREKLFNDNEDYSQLDKFDSWFSEEGVINMQSITNMIFVTGFKKDLISLWNILS